MAICSLATVRGNCGGLLPYWSVSKVCRPGLAALRRLAPQP